MGIGPTAPTVYTPSPHTAPLITGAGRTYLLSPLALSPPCEMSAWSLSFFTGLGSRLQNGKCTLLGYEGAGVRGLELSAPLPVCPP